jgi:cyanate lyase
MTSIQKQTFDTMQQLKIDLGRKPEPQEVADALGKDLNNVLRVLKRLALYEDRELLTESETLVYRVYRKGLTFNDLSEMTGLTTGMVKFVLKQLSAKGVIERKKYEKANRDEAPPTYISITEGDYKGWRGYIGKNDKCTVFDCFGNEIEKYFEPNEYEVIERRKT